MGFGHGALGKDDFLTAEDEVEIADMVQAEE